MKIVIFELEDWERQVFERLGGEHDVKLLSVPLTRKTAAEHADAESYLRGEGQNVVTGAAEAV